MDGLPVGFAFTTGPSGGAVWVNGGGLMGREGEKG